MNPWSKRPGKKVSVPRFSLESWAQHMADPKQYASMLREHARSIREQLKKSLAITVGESAGN